MIEALLAIAIGLGIITVAVVFIVGAAFVFSEYAFPLFFVGILLCAVGLMALIGQSLLHASEETSTWILICFAAGGMLCIGSAIFTEDGE